MEFRHNDHYYRGVRHLFYEIGKAKVEMDNKVTVLLPLTERPEYSFMAELIVRSDLKKIREELEKFDRDIRFDSSLDFEASAKTLLNLRIKLNECEVRLFEYLRNHLEKTKCKCCSTNTCNTNKNWNKKEMKSYFHDLFYTWS